LDGGDDFIARDVPPAICDKVFEQGHDFTGWQVCVQLAGNPEKPSVDAFTGARWSGQKLAQEWRQPIFYLWSVRHVYSSIVSRRNL
jgi:hypothetical protein